MAELRTSKLETEYIIALVLGLRSLACWHFFSHHKVSLYKRQMLDNSAYYKQLHIIIRDNCGNLNWPKR